MRKVVNISSTSGVNGNAGQSNYSAGKAGIVGLTKTLAKEFGRYDVTVNAVAFGYIQTRLTKPLNEGEAGEIEVQGRKVKIGVQGGRIAAMNQMIPLGRGGLPEEAAGSVYLFCSPDSDYVSGQCLVVNGGLYIHAGAAGSHPCPRRDPVGLRGGSRARAPWNGPRSRQEKRPRAPLLSCSR